MPGDHDPDATQEISRHLENDAEKRGDSFEQGDEDGSDQKGDFFDERDRDDALSQFHHYACQRLQKLQSSVNSLSLPDSPTIQVQALKARLDFLYERFENDYQVYMVAGKQANDGSYSRICSLSGQFEDLYEDINTTLCKFLHKPPDPPSTQKLGDSSFLSSLLSQANTSLLTLPKLDAPKFSGIPHDWDVFIGRFEALISNNSAFSADLKFQYLLNALDRETLKLVSHLTPTAENFQVAMTILKQRFDNPRRLATFHISHLLKLSNVTSKSTTSLTTFLDALNTHFRCLEAIDGVDPFQSLFVSYILSKFEPELLNLFESKHSPNTSFPTYEGVLRFLTTLRNQRENAQLLHASADSKPSAKPITKATPQNTSAFVAATSAPGSAPVKCLFCNSDLHKIGVCPKFTAKTVAQRRTWVRENSKCFNCLGRHSVMACKSKYKCLVCQRRHHSLLHFSQPQPSSEKVVPTTPSPDSAKPVAVEDSSAPVAVGLTAQSNHSRYDPILMATAEVKLEVPGRDSSMLVRAVVDTAAGGSFLINECAQALGVAVTKSNQVIGGLGRSACSAVGMCSLTISNRKNEVLVESHPFIVLHTISHNTPSVTVSLRLRQELNGVYLADPSFGDPGILQAIIGADLAPLVFTGSPSVLGPSLPMLVPSFFGHIIMGKAPSKANDEKGEGSQGISCVAQPVLALAANFLPEEDTRSLDTVVRRFWEVEEPPPVPSIKEEADEEAEAYFLGTTTRLNDGRYQVRLPFVSVAPQELGDSFSGAYARFMALERRFERDPTFKKLYTDFMNDYIEQGHMRRADGLPKYYIPHHGIFKKRGDTEKIRVVFNASSQSTSRVSLNDVLYSGPKLQPLLADILSLFRCYVYVFSCDIRQMFRQIQMDPLDQPYQCILWRDHPSKPLDTFYLTTVTYGTRPAPYLALRVIKQLAVDEQARFPQAAKVLLSNIFVDDVAVGAFTLPEALELRDQVVAMLAKGGFTLSKWSVNHPLLVPSGSESPDSKSVSLLGVDWNYELDKLSVKSDCLQQVKLPSSKRTILSEMARVYDPCGWVSPVVFRFKCFIQKLWVQKLSWDQKLTPTLQKEWCSLYECSKKLETLKLPRSVVTPHATEYALHGFSDASLKGCAAVLYLVAYSDGETQCSLVAARTRVAPLKRQTIPRLELMGAHLLALLANHYFSLLSTLLPVSNTFLWTDSVTVLSWIGLEPVRIKDVFVGNRVAQIQNWSETFRWNHVISEQNPADIASRGASMAELEQAQLWWRGPPWLCAPKDNLPIRDFRPCNLAIALVTSAPVAALVSPQIVNQVNFSCSSWEKVIRVVRVMFRWKTRLEGKETTISPLLAVCHLIQRESFSELLRALRHGRPFDLSYRRLNLFIDKRGMLRVGGRLVNSHSAVRRQPILLPKQHPLVHLLVEYYHRALLHAGPSLLASHLLGQFWIISVKQLCRSITFKCVKCFRAKPRGLTPVMGPLPGPRVNISLPFVHVGMDYAGPFCVKSSTLRRAPVLKAYVCIFICFVTTAVHLEVAEDLTADTFITVLRKFIARRGSPSILYSDCGTNFVGAAAICNKHVQSFLKSDAVASAVKDFCERNQFVFKFNTPSSPHQGGLWERAVRTMKQHINRVLGAQTPTLLVFSSLITQIEGVMNSRPLTAISSDPDSLEPLTPAHFLVGRPLTLPLGENLVEGQCTPKGLRLLQAQLNSFWTRWRREYLPGLQKRGKWLDMNDNLKVGDLVVIDDSSLPPTMWMTGRVVSVVEGSDGVVRRAVVKTTRGTYQRPAVKLYRLPIHDN